MPKSHTAQDSIAKRCARHEEEGIIEKATRLPSSAGHIWASLATIAAVAFLFMALGATAADAGTENGVCMVDRYNATKPASVTDLNCTSNDVQLAVYIVEGPTSCVEGEDIDVTLVGQFVATSNERWDVGVFISQDGLTPNRVGGTCYSDYLNPVSADNTDLNLLGGAGPFYNGEITEDPGDTCGDIQQGVTNFLRTDQITIKCQDNTGDGMVDIPSCTVWANSRSDGTANKPSCNSEEDVTAETTAKCTCDDVETNLEIAGTLTLIKTVVNDNGGTLQVPDFPLFMNGAPVNSGQLVGFDAGTLVTASETQQAGYTASTWGGDCAADGSVTIESGVDKVCTITNNDQPPSLTLVKQVINDNGGTAVAGDWTLTAAGYDAASPDAGTYDLSETGPANYTLTSLTCDNAVGQVTSVTLGLGENVTCTFVNDDDAPSLTLVKQVINDNGGTAIPADWTLTATGYDAASPDAGTYDLSESGPANYTLTSLTCDNSAGQVTSVTLGLGENVTCTFVNDDDAPSLTLVKQVINDNGGTAVPGDWTLTAAGYDAASPDAGTYLLSESGPANYTLTSLTCDNSIGQVGSVTLGLGEHVTCTFVNDDDAPSLTLVKQVINDNGGTAAPGDWTLTAAGYTPANPQTGTYALSELGPAGYTLTSLTCDNAVGQVTSVTLGLGDNVTCTFVNDDDGPSLTLVKVVINDNGGTAIASDWTLSANGPTPISGAGGVSSGVNVGTYTLSETGPGGYTASSWVCVGGTQSGDQITLALGESATCTITNDDDAPKLTLVKVVVNDNGGTAVASDWTLTAAGPTGFSGASGISSDASFDQGTYDLSESGPSNYTASNWVCTGGQVDGDTVSVGLGDDITCTITNNDDAPSLTLVKVVINDNGGTAVPGDWTLTAAGYDAASPDAGSYDLSESGPAGYTLTSLTCDNAAGQVTSVTLGLGEDVTCTFVNDDDAPSLTLVKIVVNDNGGTAVPGDWTLTAAGYDAASPDAGTYDLSESGPANYTLTSLTCDNAAGQVTSVTLGLGEDVTCTFVNDDDRPKLTLVKIVDNGANPGGTAVATEWTLSASGPTGFSGTTGVMSDASFDQGSYDLSESGPAGYIASNWVCNGGQVDGDTVDVGLGDDITCVITNTAMAMAEVNKTSSGVAAAGFTFEIREGASLTDAGTILATGTTDALGYTDFSGFKLVPGDTYQLCETGMMPGWSNTIDGFTPLGATPEGGDNSTECVDFTAGVGETVVFNVENTPPPGGDARTIGFWKNWTSCDGHGNQDPVLDETLVAAGGSILLGDFAVTECAVAVDLLDKRDIKDPSLVKDGKKKAGDAAYGLAAQLLAAKLNVAAQAGTCTALFDAIDDADALLSRIGFDGTGNYLKGKQGAADRAEATTLAGILDDYNNNMLCTP